MQTDKEFLEFLLRTISEYLQKTEQKCCVSSVANPCLRFQSQYKQAMEGNKKNSLKKSQEFFAETAKTEKTKLQNKSEIRFYNRLLKRT